MQWRHSGVGQRGFTTGLSTSLIGTPMQFVYVGLMLVTLVWPAVESAVLLVRLIAAVILSLALGIPHSKLVCSHCRQGECGACPVGRMLRKA